MLVYKKEKILNWKNKSEVFKKFTNLEFMNFLYSSYGFKKETDVLKNKGDENIIEPEIIIDKNLIDRTIRKSTASHRTPNFEEINKKKSAVGLNGEDYVLNYEKTHNKKYNRKIKRISDDPSFGYDILSFNDEGKEKHIEVKTCISGNLDKVDFYITSNEKSHLENDDYYYIYYVCGLRSNKPKIIILTKDNLTRATFEPIAYKITGKIEEE